jgi:hypothetical protein
LTPVRVEAARKSAGCKLIRVSAEIGEGIIRSIKIRGDFFASPAEGFDRVEERLPGAALADIAETFERLLLEEGVEVQGINGLALREALDSALRADAGAFGGGSPR